MKTLTVVACGALIGWAAAADPDAPGVPQLRVAHVGHDHHLALYAAALDSAEFKGEWGLWLEERKPREVYDLVEGGRTVARLLFIQTAGGSAMPAAMSRGEIDVGLGGTAAIAKFADRGHPIKIIAPLQTDGDQLVMRRGSGVTNWPSFVAAAKGDGRPLKIGYKEPMAVAKLILVCALEAEGVPYAYESRPDAGVELVNFGSEKSPLPLLESGALDGFVMNQPGTAMAVHKGLGQVAAELRDLPPEGRWMRHPCCCVAATEAALREQPEAVKALLKLLHLSTARIRANPAWAVDAAVRWTRNPPEVEAQSVPTSDYGSEADDAWLRGLRTWHETVQAVSFLDGRYAGLSADEFVRAVTALELGRAAADELRADGRLPEAGRRP